MNYNAGDLFALKLNVPQEQWMCGRILLNMSTQCFAPNLLAPDSALRYFGGLLIEVYREVTPTPSITPAVPLLPGLFTDFAGLNNKKRWVILGHQPVDPLTVEFPEVLVFRGDDIRFIRGEISLPISLSLLEYMRLGVYPTGVRSYLVKEICLYYLGRGAEIISNNPYVQDVELRSLKHTDLRFTDQRNRIYHLLGADATQSYYQMALHYGYDLRRLYPTAP